MVLGLLASPALAAERAVEPKIRLPASGGLRVALTFDACPGGFDRRVAEALVALGARATIFVTAVWMRQNPEGLGFLRAHPELFALENHGERHVPPVLGTGTVFGLKVAGDVASVRAEVAGGAAALGGRARWYRAATGFYSPEVLPVIREMGFGIGAYSFSADQGASLPAGQVTAKLAGARDGDVVVAHINQPRRASGAGVAEGVRVLRGRGAEFVWL